jgi:hypothetical protein
VEAFWRTLSKHHDTIQDQLQQANERPSGAHPHLDERDLASIGSGLDPDDDSEDDVDSSEATERSGQTPLADAAEAEADRQTEMVTRATLGDTRHPGFAREMSLLREMLDAANKARSQPDEKLKKLFEYIDHNMLEGEGGRTVRRGWNDHRIIVFTEYDDTIGYIRRQLEAHLQATDRADARLAIYRETTTIDERQEIKEAFNTDPADHPVRILLATDAARGLEPPDVLLEPDPLRYPVESGPTRTAERPHRPEAPEGAGGLLPLLPL